MTGKLSRREWASVLVLGVTQALSQSGTAMVMTVTALTGAYLADRPELATLPLAFQFLGTTAATIPAALLMGRFGRRIGLSAGQAIGAVSALVAAYGILQGQFWVFAAGSMGIGVHNAFWQQLRFAASEAVAEPARPRAISLVLAGGILAAPIGPWLAIEARDLLAPVVFAGNYVVLAGLCAAAVFVLRGTHFESPPKSARRGDGRSIGTIVRQPIFIIALMSTAFGYGLMSLVMTVTPMAIVANGHGFENAAFVIQWHVLAMFVPSLFTGNLVARFGALPVICLGALLDLVAMSAGVTGTGLQNFWIALVAIGIGWNFMFVGGTTLLVDICWPEERARIQALNDFVVFGTVSVCGLLAGYLYSKFGWSGVNSVIVLPVAAILIFAASMTVRQLRPSA